MKSRILGWAYHVDKIEKKNVRSAFKLLSDKPTRERKTFSKR